MDHATREERGALIVSLGGEVDLEASPRARELLLDSVGRARHVLVDLSQVEYIDSSGIASLVEALQRARERGSEFGLVAVSPSPLRVLELARLDRVFVIYATLADGLDARA